MTSASTIVVVGPVLASYTVTPTTGRRGVIHSGMALDTHAAVKTLTKAGASEALAVAVIDVAREATTAGTGERGWWERWGVPITALGVMVAIVGLVVNGLQQASMAQRQLNATEIATAVRIRNELVDGGRRFEEARAQGDEGTATFERNNLLFRIEAYKQDLEVLGVEGSMTLPLGVLRVLAEGFCGPVEPAGKHFQDLGFPVAGALADEFDVMTPGAPCSNVQ